MPPEGDSKDDHKLTLEAWRGLLDSCNETEASRKEALDKAAIETATPKAPDKQNLIVLFDEDFWQRWKAGEVILNGDDQLAAAKLHIQLVSRITTQRLPYVDGEEVTALTSVYKLFDQAREIFKSHPKSSVTDAVVWHVMNTHVRPFTAKWHRQSERGALAALDATDIFRHELAVLQKYLVRFDALLVAIRDGAATIKVADSGKTDRETKIEDEMKGELKWQIHAKLGGLHERTAKTINAEEERAVNARRKHYADKGYLGDLNLDGAEWMARSHATALAISGGGIRSATFGLGVLAALARRNLLYQFDYLSTVSGGGYLGSFLTTFLSTDDRQVRGTSLVKDASQAEGASLRDGGPPTQSAPPADSAKRDGSVRIGLGREDLPFKRKEGEAAALRHVRHHSKYLATGRLWERLQMAFAQVYGMVMNGLGFAYAAFVAAFAEYLLRLIPWPHRVWTALVVIVLLALAATPFTVPIIRRKSPASPWPDRIVAGLFVFLLILLAWQGLWLLHECIRDPKYLIASAAVPLLASALLALVGNLAAPLRLILIVVSVVAAPLLFLGIEHAAFSQITAWDGLGVLVAIGVAVVGGLLFWRLFDINVTAPHRLYKTKLGEAYLIQPDPPSANATLCKKNVSIPLSDCDPLARAPYHLVNCALNVPGSQDSRMQGRLTDFFLFSQHFCGSPLTGYHPTRTWQDLNLGLDLGTAMAISGAAAAPQMGLGTIKNLSFWLALFNVRLGYWIRKPEPDAPAATGETARAQDKPTLSERISASLQAACSTAKSWLADANRGTPPGLIYLLREMFGWADENHTYINVSDGGHIENLGVYELLRRRCKYIVAIDGEQDEKMTFQGLTTLLRLAYIDLGIKIDVGLDALRLATTGYSHSHFALCRIHYPMDERDGKEEGHGYLIYLKLSLTGNEGEFIKRYKLDEPAFPHTSTANQFFSEAQFEAYRSLGEHVGDKMFLPAIVGEKMSEPKADVVLEKWFAEIGKNMLEPLPEKTAQADAKEETPPAPQHG